MQRTLIGFTLAIVVLSALPVGADELAARPLALVQDMDEGPLKSRLLGCAHQDFRQTDFSIGHRGAPLQFPEHTRESYEAAAKMGAGILECDVTFTRDQVLVCRHSQCDLHTTTNILATDLASKCSVPFQPAKMDERGNMMAPAAARCCTSDITLAEFKTLQGKMDTFNPRATTVAEYINGTAVRGTLLTHKESIQLFKKLGVKMTPELKSPNVSMPFNGFSQQDYALKMIGEYKQAGVPARHVWAQSFNIEDVRHWIEHEPRFGKQAVYLDGRYSVPGFDHRQPSTWKPSMDQLVADGVRIIAPPLWMLVDSGKGRVVPSRYAHEAKAAGLSIITWTFERSGSLVNGGGWYYQTLNGVNSNPLNPSAPELIDNDGDMLTVLDVLAREVGVSGVFSDWPATVTYYANCMGLE